MITTNEPDRLVCVGVRHRLELHGVREQVYNYRFLAEGGEGEPEYIEKSAVDFVFRSPGIPSAMLDSEDATAVRDWLSAWLGSADTSCCAHPRCPGGSLCCCLGESALVATPEPSSPPWDAADGCFGHCDPEGWHRPCRDHTDGSAA